MKKLFERIFPSNNEAPLETAVPQPVEDEALRLRNEAQSLRMELEAREERISRLEQEVERLRERQQRLSEETASARMEALLAETAAPISQILTQADLLEKHGKPVQARDVLLVARRLVKVLEAHGLAIINAPGTEVMFDPTQHAPISDSQPQEGQPVIVRFAGVSYQGKTLYKTIVEQETNARSSGS